MELNKIENIFKYVKLRVGNLTKLENELKVRAENCDEEAQHYYKKYDLIKDYLQENYYPWIHDKCRYFTDHGENHVKSIILATSDLLKLQIESNGLKSVEIFLLLSSIIWHDVGMIHGRDLHGENVKNVMDKMSFVYDNATIKNAIVQIVKAHTGDLALSKVEKEIHISTKYGNYKIYLRSLAALLRFCDEISENHTRISIPVLESGEVPDENRLFWEYASCITASFPDPRENTVIIDIRIPVNKVLKKFNLGGKKIYLVEYIIKRLAKINSERVYCAPEFRVYVDINSLDVKLSLIDGYDKVDGFETRIVIDESYYYSIINLTDKFFKENPLWVPNELKKRLVK